MGCIRTLSVTLTSKLTDFETMHLLHSPTRTRVLSYLSVHMPPNMRITQIQTNANRRTDRHTERHTDGIADRHVNRPVGTRRVGARP